MSEDYRRSLSFEELLADDDKVRELLNDKALEAAALAGEVAGMEATLAGRDQLLADIVTSHDARLAAMKSGFGATLAGSHERYAKLIERARAMVGRP